MTTMKQIWKRIPMELVISNIMPFAYTPQPKNLQTDIQSYVSGFTLVKEIYFEQFHEYNMDPTQIPEDWIYDDMFRFAHGGTEQNPVRRFNVNLHFINIFRRHRQFKEQQYGYIKHFISNIFDVDLVCFPSAVRIKILWGLFTPTERERFVTGAVAPRDPNSTVFLNFNNYYVVPNQDEIIPNVIGVEWFNNEINNNIIIYNELGI